MVVRGVSFCLKVRGLTGCEDNNKCCANKTAVAKCSIKRWNSSVYEIKGLFTIGIICFRFVFQRYQWFFITCHYFIVVCLLYETLIECFCFFLLYLTIENNWNMCSIINKGLDWSYSILFLSLLNISKSERIFIKLY